MDGYTIEQLQEVDRSIAQKITNLLRQHVPSSNDISFDHLRKIIQQNGSYIFIAKTPDNKIVGMVTLISVLKLDKFEKTMIEDLVVDELYRRKGIGEELIKYAVKQAHSLGLKHISLTSHSKRIAANNLYKKLGFKLYETNNYTYEIK